MTCFWPIRAQISKVRCDKTIYSSYGWFDDTWCFHWFWRWGETGFIEKHPLHRISWENKTYIIMPVFLFEWLNAITNYPISCTSSSLYHVLLQNGDECWCSSTTVFGINQSNRCTQFCGSDPSMKCGGPDALDVYEAGIFQNDRQWQIKQFTKLIYYCLFLFWYKHFNIQLLLSQFSAIGIIMCFL